MGLFDRFRKSRPTEEVTYSSREMAEQGHLLKSVLLNYSTDGVSLWPVTESRSI